MSWKKVSAVLCDKKLPARVKCTRALSDQPARKNESCRVENGEMDTG